MSFMKKLQAAAAAAVAGEKVAEVSDNLVQLEKPMTEGRKKSLEKCMDSTMVTAMREVQHGGYWKTGPDVEQIEEELHKIFADVLRGLRRLSDYRAEVERWKRAGTTIH